MERFCRPNIVAIEGDVLPAERGDVGEQLIADDLAAGTQLVNGAPEIDGVPEDDGRNGQIEAGSPVSLIFESSVADFSETMKEHRPGERVARFALVEAGICPSPQRRIADPVEGEKGAFEASNLPERLCQRILFGIGREPTVPPIIGVRAA